jgi:signal transduction histidine kinase
MSEGTERGLLGRLSLRGFLLLATGIAASLALAASVALVGYAAHYRSTNRAMSMTVERLRAAEQLQAELLALHQQTGTRLLTDPVGSLPEGRGFGERAARQLESARSSSLKPPEARAIDELEASIERYLDIQQRVSEGALPPAAALRALGHDFEAAFSASERLIDLESALSVESHRDARVGQTAALAASAIIALLVATLAMVVIGERSHIFRPLMSLREAMASFGRGRYLAAEEAGTRDLREITRTFNEMASALARNREAQLGYLSGVAHDLRNPLSALKSAARLLATPGREPPSEQRTRDLAGMIVRQVERLDRMAGDLLDSTRIEAGRLELKRERTDLRALAAESVDLFAASSSSHQLQLDAPESLSAEVDPLRLSQVLNNLLSNAIKYSPGGGLVQVSLQRKGGEARLSVTDHGIGIPAEELETIFQPFRRSSTTREGIPGVGLGLSVARRIVEGHGGHLEVQSREGQGSTFAVVLPLDAPEPRARTAMAPLVPEPSA